MGFHGGGSAINGAILSSFPSSNHLALTAAIRKMLLNEWQNNCNVFIATLGLVTKTSDLQTEYTQHIMLLSCKSRHPSAVLIIQNLPYKFGGKGDSVQMKISINIYFLINTPPTFKCSFSWDLVQHLPDSTNNSNFARPGGKRKIPHTGDT